jgi:hypothetical protein
LTNLYYFANVLFIRKIAKPEAMTESHGSQGRGRFAWKCKPVFYSLPIKSAERQKALGTHPEGADYENSV